MGYIVEVDGKEYDIPDKFKDLPNSEALSFVETKLKSNNLIKETMSVGLANAPSRMSTRPQEFIQESKGIGPNLVGNLIAGLEVIDRPRAANVGAVTAFLEGGGIEDIKKGYAKGIKGEEHKLAGDYIFDAFQKEMKKPVNKRNLLIVNPMLQVFAAKWPAETAALTATIGGIFYDTILDPATYTGTKLGKEGAILAIKKSLAEEGLEITDPKMLAYIKKNIDPKAVLAPTLKGRLAKGQTKVTIGAIPIPRKVASVTVGVIQAGAKAVMANKYADDLFKGFSVTFGLTKDTLGFSKIESKFKDVYYMARYHSIKDNVKIAKTIKDISKATGVSNTAIRRFITEGIELGDISNIRTDLLDEKTLKVLHKSPEIKKTISELSTKQKLQFDIETAAGINLSELGSITTKKAADLELTIKAARAEGKTTIVNPLTGKPKQVSTLEKDLIELKIAKREEDRISYFLHAITPQAKKLVIRAKEGKIKSVLGGRRYSTSHASTLQRNFREKTVAQINKDAKAGTLKGYEGIKFKDGFFYDDPAIIQTLRDLRHRKAMAVVALVNTTRNRFGVNVEDLRGVLGKSKNIDQLTTEAGLLGYRQIKNVSLRGLTKGHVFPDEVAKRLEVHYDAFTDINKTNAFLDTYDGVQGWWKAFTLGIFPAYHFRNAVGNLWNNYVTGTTDMKVYGQAYEIQRGAQGSIKTVDGRTISYDTIRDHLDELGVHNRGFVATDIEVSIKAELNKGNWNLLSREGKAIHIGKVVGTKIENNARIGKFIDELQKGKGVVDASDGVKRALFDYQDLTKFEKTVAKRLMPFYTWSRKNIPLQLVEMVKNPGKYKMIDNIRREVERNSEEPTDPNEYVLQEWLLNGYPTRVGYREVNGKMLPHYFLLGGWHPGADIWKVVSQPSQQLIDMLSPIIRIPGEFMTSTDWFTWNELDSDIKTDFLGYRISEPMKKALYNFRILATADKIARDQGWYEKTPSLFADPNRHTTPEEALLQFFTGIKSYTSDLEFERTKRLSAIRKRLDTGLKSKARKQIIRGEKPGELSDLITKITDRELDKLEKLIKKSK